MFHNGSMKDNSNFKTICPLKQKEQSIRITYQNKFQRIYMDPSSGELEMEEYRLKTIGSSVQKVGEYTRICNEWEIYKLLFLLHNVNPVWVEVHTIIDKNLGKVFIIHLSSNLTIVILVDKRRGYQTGFLIYNPF